MLPFYVEYLGKLSWNKKRVKSVKFNAFFYHHEYRISGYDFFYLISCHILRFKILNFITKVHWFGRWRNFICLIRFENQIKVSPQKQGNGRTNEAKWIKSELPFLIRQTKFCLIDDDIQIRIDKQHEGFRGIEWNEDIINIIIIIKQTSPVTRHHKRIRC